MKLLLGLAVSVMLLSACFGGDDSGSDQGGRDAGRILRDSAAAAEDVQSFHFRLTHRNGNTRLPLNLELESAEGDFSAPARLKANLRAKAPGGINVTVDVISIDNQTWITQPFSRDWQRQSGFSLRDLADPAALMREVLPALENARVVAENEVDGVRTYQIEGNISPAELEEAIGVAEAGNDVKVEAWIGADDSLPRRVRITGALSEDDDKDVERQIDLSRFDQPVTINPPE